VRAILRDDPRARIIAVSGGRLSQAMNALSVAQKFGAIETLAKPFQREDLLAAVERLLSRV
jgi:FixJ family two-component response regulator